MLTQSQRAGVIAIVFAYFVAVGAGVGWVVSRPSGALKMASLVATCALGFVIVAVTAGAIDRFGRWLVSIPTAARCAMCGAPLRYGSCDDMCEQMTTTPLEGSER